MHVCERQTTVAQAWKKQGIAQQSVVGVAAPIGTRNLPKLECGIESHWTSLLAHAPFKHQRTRIYRIHCACSSLGQMANQGLGFLLKL